MLLKLLEFCCSRSDGSGNVCKGICYSKALSLSMLFTLQLERSSKCY
jgi:hypothetical protein